jgi:MFS transporter, DHA1 family, tetracycline resistance protein
MKPRKATIAFILGSVMLDVLALGITIPVVAKLIEEFLNGDTKAALSYVGFFGTVWAFLQFFCSPIIGGLSDRFGRRPILLVSAFGATVDYVLLAVAPNLVWLFIGRVVSGVTAASFSTAQAYLADVTPAEKRSDAYGLFGAVFGLGFVLGPALGGALMQIDIRVPFWVAATLSWINFGYRVYVLPESLALEKRDLFHWTRANPLGSLRLLMSKSGLLAMALTVFLYQLSHQVFQNVFVLYTGERFEWTGLMVGAALTTVGLLNFLVQGALVRPAIKRFGERPLVFTGLSGGILGFLAYALSNSGGWFFASTVVFALMGFFNSSIQGLMSKKLGPSEQGQLSGANSSLMGIAGMIGPYLFTEAYRMTIHTPWQGAPFFLASAILVIAFALAAYSVPKRSVPKPS